VIIRRIQVEEGFLDGLDLTFSPGLNVLIGARGTGKTSIIELLRFVLGAAAFSAEAQARAAQQASGVLAGGRVTVEVDVDGQLHTVSRQAVDEPPPSSPFRITVVAQNELESVANQASGRLRLVDRLIPDLLRFDAIERSSSAELRSMTAELAGLLSEGLHLASAVEAFTPDKAQLAQALAEQEAVLTAAAATQAEEQELLSLQSQGAELAAKEQVLQRTIADVDRYRLALSSALQPPDIPAWPDDSQLDPSLQEAATELRSIASEVQVAQARVESVVERLRQIVVSDQQARSRIEEQVRSIRSRLEGLHAGASAITRRVAALQERDAQRKALEQRLEQRRAAFRRLSDLREEKYRALDDARTERFELRRRRVEDLNQALAPHVRVQLTRAAAIDAYTSAIIGCLRGSGIHYRNLAPVLAKSLTPLELVSAAEWHDAAAVCNATGISADRADAVLSALQRADLSDIIAAPVDDTIDLELLDGATYKTSGELSIGQRCTVVLPLLLADRGDTLVIDQPEDHLDNAFIAETLVQGLLQRHSSSQVIVSTHNANIPVLGGAENVIVLGSDGKRGFVSQQGRLEEPSTVDAITRVMEGGRAAFARRAELYGVNKP
jgi:hypothetical protein